VSAACLPLGALELEDHVDWCRQLAFTGNVRSTVLLGMCCLRFKKLLCVPPCLKLRLGALSPHCSGMYFIRD
jgi:hypothetical protein